MHSFAHEMYRLLTLYQTLFDAIHAKSGQERTLKLQYIRTSQESVMGWVRCAPLPCFVMLFDSPDGLRLRSHSSYTSPCHLGYRRALLWALRML